MRFLFICWIFSGLFFVHTGLFAGSLTVGTKVIFPGGSGQPPKEKDTGVTLRAEARGNSAEEDIQEELEELFDEEDYEELLKRARNNPGKEGRVYEAIALNNLDRKKEARKLAKELLNDQKLVEEFREKLCEEFEIDGVEDLRMDIEE